MWRNEERKCDIHHYRSKLDNWKQGKFCSVSRSKKLCAFDHLQIKIKFDLYINNNEVWDSQPQGEITKSII